jgi:hypothetical protein
MLSRWSLYLAMLVLPSVGAAGTIDVSAETSVVVHTGDTLVFQLLTSNFGANAARFGLPAQVTDVFFALTSTPLSDGGTFAATLESADGSASATFGDLSFVTGRWLQSILYRGEVATLEGYLHMSAELSGAIFSGPSVEIALQNEGSDVTVGLAPYSLRQSVLAGLSDGPLSVGAIPTSVTLESQDKLFNLMEFGPSLDFSDNSDVPEPRTGGLLLWGGATLCGLSRVLARLSRRCK